VAYSLLTTLKHSAPPTNGPKIDAQVYSWKIRRYANSRCPFPDNRSAPVDIASLHAAGSGLATLTRSTQTGVVRTTPCKD